MALPSFIFDGNTQNESPESIRRKRDLVAKLLGGYSDGNRAPRNVGEGIYAIGNAIAGGIDARRAAGLEQQAAEAERAGRAGGDALVRQYFGGGSPTLATPSAMPSSMPARQASAGDDTYTGAPRGLFGSESGGRFNAQNDVSGAGGMRGHFGRVQFGRARLQEAAAAGAIPQGTTPQQFMADPELQRSAERWHFADIDSKIAANGLDRMVGQPINGVPITRDGMVAAAHLGGFEGLKKFIESGGRYNPADANGTSLMNYFSRMRGDSRPSMPRDNGTIVAQAGPQETPMAYAPPEAASQAVQAGLMPASFAQPDMAMPQAIPAALTNAFVPSGGMPDGGASSGPIPPVIPANINAPTAAPALSPPQQSSFAPPRPDAGQGPIDYVTAPDAGALQFAAMQMGGSGQSPFVPPQMRQSPPMGQAAPLPMQTNAPQEQPQPMLVSQGMQAQANTPAAPVQSDATLLNLLNSPFVSSEAKQLAIAQYKARQEAANRDPNDAKMKSLQVQDLERKVNTVENEYREDPATGRIMQRPKGSNGPFVPAEGLGEKVEPPTSDQKELDQINKELAQAGKPPLRLDEWKLQKGRAGATSITNDLSGGSSKQVFDTMAERQTAAQAAVNGLVSLREARKAVEGGGIFGAGADSRLAFAKLGQLFGFEDGRIVNSETFRSAIAPQIAAVMKATVGSTQISNADREFAAAAAGGSISLDERSIKRLLDIQERASKVAVDRHKATLDKVYPDTPDGKFARERALFGVDVPAEEPQPVAAPTAPAPQPGPPAKINSEAEFNALPSGTVFISPDGKTRTKP